MNRHLPAIRVHDPGKDLEEGALAASVRPDNPERLSFSDGE